MRIAGQLVCVSIESSRAFDRKSGVLHGCSLEERSKAAAASALRRACERCDRSCCFYSILLPLSLPPPPPRLLPPCIGSVTSLNSGGVAPRLVHLGCENCVASSRRCQLRRTHRTRTLPMSGTGREERVAAAGTVASVGKLRSDRRCQPAPADRGGHLVIEDLQE